MYFKVLKNTDVSDQNLIHNSVVVSNFIINFSAFIQGIHVILDKNTLIYSLAHILTHTLTYALTQTLTHALTYTLIYTLTLANTPKYTVPVRNAQLYN